MYILTWKCASRHNGVQFFISHLASWLRTRRFSEPTFRPSGAPNHWKNTVFRDFPTFSRICIFFLLIFSLLTLFTSAFQLSILSEVSLLNFLRLFFNRMILNSGRHTQPDPQSCCVRSLGGRRRGAQKQTTHQETKTKLSSATPNRDKTIHCQRKHRRKHPASNVAAESAPHPRHVAKACDNNNNMVLWQRLATCRRG